MQLEGLAYKFEEKFILKFENTQKCFIDSQTIRTERQVFWLHLLKSYSYLYSRILGIRRVYTLLWPLKTINNCFTINYKQQLLVLTIVLQLITWHILLTLKVTWNVDYETLNVLCYVFFFLLSQLSNQWHTQNIIATPSN